MAHVLQRPLYPRVPPTWILRSHPHDEATNLGEHPGAPWSLPSVCPFPYNQFAMPSKNGIGRHQRCHVTQYGPSETLSEHGQAPALHIIQPQSKAGQLCFQCTILLAKKRDHIALLALEPSKQGREQDL